MPSYRPLPGTILHKLNRELLALPVRMGGMGLTNPSQVAASEYIASANISGPLAQPIKSQVQEPPDENETHAAQREMRQVKNQYPKEKLDQVKGLVSGKTLRAVDLATQKGASSWLTVLPIRDMNFDLNKSEFRDAVKLRYNGEVPDTLFVCVCGDHFNVDHAMICKRARGFVIQRHNELRDLEAEMLRMVCNGIEIEPVLQDITGEEFKRGANTAPDARLDIVAREFWERQRPAFFDVRICHFEMQTPIEIRIQTRYSGNMKQRRSASSLAEF